MAPNNMIAVRVDEDLATALNAEVARTGATISDVVRAPLVAAYAAPRPSYGPGSRFSLVGDAWALASRGATADGAEQRLAQLRADLAAGHGPQFTTSTTNASQVVPPGYAPLVPEQATGRPLLSLCAYPLPITNAVPFGTPGTATVSGVGSHTEGNNPSAGTLTLSGGTVAPSGISGVFDVSRELADSANPAIDAVALGAMQESYAQQTEALVAAEITSVTAGTITSGLVPSGAQVATTASGTVAVDTKKLIARAVKLRRRRPQAVVATADTAFSEALAAGLDEATGDATALWRPMGTPTNLSADLTASSGDTAVVVVSPPSMWAWESPMQRFEWEQVAGPAVIRLSLFGYFGVKVLRPVGIAALRVS